MIPVLSVADVDAAIAQLTSQLGFTQVDGPVLAFGDQRIALCTPGNEPADLWALELDHIAFCVPDLPDYIQKASANGGVLHDSYTPDGIVSLPSFWNHGYNYIFFNGPDGSPFEFAMRPGETPKPNGQEHFALRVKDVDRAIIKLTARGGQTVARFVLGQGADEIRVAFVQIGADMFEIFNDTAPRPSESWIGLIPA